MSPAAAPSFGELPAGLTGRLAAWRRQTKLHAACDSVERRSCLIGRAPGAFVQCNNSCLGIVQCTITPHI